MPLGIATNNITMENITQVANATSFPELLLNVNHYVYGGWMFFILLCVGWIILFVSLQDRDDQPLNNGLYSGGVVTIVSLFMRAIEVNKSGIVIGMLSDFQMWIFPLITIILATILWLSKKS